MSKLTRRRFLEDSLFAAAATAAVGSVPWIASKPVYGRVSPNDKLGVMIVGCGDRGGDHINGMKRDARTVILYLCDPDANAARVQPKTIDEIAQTQNGIRPKIVRDMREALSDAALDIVTCATTNHWHALTGMWAMEAGKHVYIEKPISHNIHEGKALSIAAKKYNLVVQTGTQCRSTKSNIDAVKFIREGGIGEVKFARGLCYKRRAAIDALGRYEVPASVDYDLWSGPAPIAPLTRKRFHYNWHWQRLYGNGDLGNQGPHQTDIARWFLGLDAFPKSVISYGGRLGYQAERKDENYIDAGDTANTEVSIYDYGDKCIVFETRGLETPYLNISSAENAGAKIGVIAYGSEGYMVQRDYDRSFAFDLEGNLIKSFTGGGDHYKNFIDAVEKGDPSMLNSDARCGALSAALSHLGNISYYLGENNKLSVGELRKKIAEVKSLDDNEQTLDRTLEHLEANGVDLKKYPVSLGPLLKINVEKEEFIDNAEANKMLTRDYRDPYVVKIPG